MGARILAACWVVFSVLFGCVLAVMYILTRSIFLIGEYRTSRVLLLQQTEDSWPAVRMPTGAGGPARAWRVAYG